MRKLIIAAIAGSCLAFPVLAGAQEDGANAVDHITCADGTVLKPPFASPVCKEHGEIASLTCANGATLTPPLDGKRCAPAEVKQGKPDGRLKPDSQDERGEGLGRKRSDTWPRSTFAFPGRVWRIKGNADGYADGVLDFTATGFLGLGARASTNEGHERARGLAVDTRVLVTSKTRVLDDDHHRLTGAALAEALDAADRVVVLAKLVPKAKWLKDEDDELVPTLRAKRIVIKD